MPKSRKTRSPKSGEPMTPDRWAAWNIERRSIDKLVPYARNSRTHSPEQIDQIAASMREWGWTMPCLVDEEDGLIAGHARVMAAKKNGYVEAPVIVARGWTEAQKRAYVIADNQLSLNAGWNEQMLRLELIELQGLGFDLALTGFAPMELVSFTTTPSVESAAEAQRSLMDRFGIVPFTVLNAREGWWQNRKRAWISLGIRSEVGRGENLLEFSDSVKLDGKTYKARQKSNPAHKNANRRKKMRATEAAANG